MNHGLFPTQNNEGVSVMCLKSFLKRRASTWREVTFQRKFWIRDCCAF